MNDNRETQGAGNVECPAYRPPKASPDPEQLDATPRTMHVAVFDLDGTLIRGESLLRFLRFTLGTPRLLTAIARSVGGVARNIGVRATGRGGPGHDLSIREDFKRKLIFSSLRSRSLVRIQAAAGMFVTDKLIQRVEPDAQRSLIAHQLAGHQTLLVSASPLVYVESIGNVFGVDASIGTELAVTPDGILTGELKGPNMRGVAKANAVLRWISEHNPNGGGVVVHAYGDSSGDDHLFALAGHHAHDRRVELHFTA